jgi:aspartate 1-decarboxylase
MQIQILKSKIHNCYITEANIDYIGSITIDEDLMDATDLIEGEQVHVINYRNGERLITYIIKGKRGSGVIQMNGPAALKISKGDKVIIIAYIGMPMNIAKQYRPKVIFPDKNNFLNQTGQQSYAEF